MKLRNLAAALTLLVTTACVQHTVQKKPIVDATTGMQSLSAFGGSVTFPQATWVKGALSDAESEFHREQHGGNVVWEQIPKGQSFQSWQQLYAVSAQSRRAADQTILTSAVETGYVYMLVCGPENFEVITISQSLVDATYVYVCENSPKLSVVGYGEGIGEVSLHRVAFAGSAVFKVYHSWRGPKFDFQDRSTWPVSNDELDKVKERFRQISFSDSGS